MSGVVVMVSVATSDLSDCVYGSPKETTVGKNIKLQFGVALTKEPCRSRVDFGDPIQWFVYKPDGTEIIGEKDTLKCCLAGGPYDDSYYDFPDVGDYTIKIKFCDTGDWASWKVTAKAEKGSIAVTVKYPNGNAITPQYLILYDKDWNGLKRASPSSNKYTFTDLDAGTYNVEAYKDNMFIGYVGNIKVSAGETKSVTLTTLYKRNLKVTVYYKDGLTPIDGATVKVYSWDGYEKEWDYEYKGTTNSQGKLTFSSWPTSCSGEKYKLKVEHNGYSKTKEPVYVDKDSGSSYKINLDEPVPKGSITVTVKYPSGSGITPDTAILYDSDYHDIKRLNPSSYEFTFADLNAGTYHVETYKDNMFIGGKTYIDIGTGESKSVTITTLYKRNLEVTVYYKDGLTPIDGATVKIYSWDGYEKEWDYEYKGTTNAQGKITFSSWPTSCSGEKYKLKVEHNGYTKIKEPVYVDKDSGSSYTIITDEPASVILQVPYEYQDGAEWCAPASTAMVLKYYGKIVHMWDIADALDLESDEGANMSDIFNYIMGYPDLSVHEGDDNPEVDDGEYKEWIPWPLLDWQLRDYLVSELKNDKNPIILRIGKINHAVVVVGVSQEDTSDPTFYVNDPSGHLLKEIGIDISQVIPIKYPVKWSQIKQFWGGGIGGEKGFHSISVQGNPNPPEGSLSDVNFAAYSVGQPLMAKRWYNDGLKWNFSGAEYPIDDYSASFNSTDILSMNALIANHMDSSKKYIYKFITESGNIIDSQETPIINPYGVYAVHLEKPFYEMGLNNGKRGVYIELYDLNSTLLDKIGPITFTVKNVPPNCSITTDADLGGWEWSRDKIRIWVDASDIDGNVTQVEVESSTDHSGWHNIGTDHSPPWMIWWDTTSISQDDSVWIRARAKDDSGDYSDWYESGPYKIDNNLPFTSHSLSPSSPDGENGWYKSDVTVTLTASDSGSGVYKTWYKLDWGIGHSDWMEYDGPQTIGIEGNIIFYYYSEDNACDYQGAWGNKEGEKSCSFKIDKTKPSASISINDGEEYTDSRSVTLYLSHSDDTSGVDKCRYKNEGEPWTEWESCSPTKSWTLTKGDGTKTVYYQVKDKAGNIKEVFDTIVLDTTPTDTTPPTIISVSPSGGATGVPVTTTISVTFSEAMNTASAEAAFSITPSVAGTFSWVENTMTFTPITNLAHSTTYTVTISATATDMAGNGLDGNENGIAEGSPADDYTWSFTTEEMKEYGVDLSCANPEKTIPSGGYATYNITVKNTGNVEDTIKVTPSLPPLPPTRSPWTYSLDKYSVELSPGESTKVVLTVSDISDKGLPAGSSCEVEVIGISQGDPTKSDSVLTKTTVGDWNPWNDPDSDGGESITTAELQEAIHCWLNDEPAPKTGAEITTARLQEVIHQWLVG